MASCPAPLAGNMDPAGGSKSWVSGLMLNSVMKSCVGSELFASLHGAASISPAFVIATALGHSPKGIVVLIWFLVLVRLPSGATEKCSIFGIIK